MWEIQVALMTVLVALGTMETSVPSIGKCNTTNIVAVTIPSPIQKEVSLMSLRLHVITGIQL